MEKIYKKLFGVRTFKFYQQAVTGRLPLYLIPDDLYVALSSEGGCSKVFVPSSSMYGVEPSFRPALKLVRKGSAKYYVLRRMEKIR